MGVSKAIYLKDTTELKMVPNPSHPYIKKPGYHLSITD
jgi:hypothetical protein